MNNILKMVFIIAFSMNFVSAATDSFDYKLKLEGKIGAGVTTAGLATGAGVYIYAYATADRKAMLRSTNDFLVKILFSSAWVTTLGLSIGTNAWEKGFMEVDKERMKKDLKALKLQILAARVTNMATNLPASVQKLVEKFECDSCQTTASKLKAMGKVFDTVDVIAENLSKEVDLNNHEKALSLIDSLEVEMQLTEKLDTYYTPENLEIAKRLLALRLVILEK